MFYKKADVKPPHVITAEFKNAMSGLQMQHAKEMKRWAEVRDDAAERSEHHKAAFEALSAMLEPYEMEFTEHDLFTEPNENSGAGESS